MILAAVSGIAWRIEKTGPLVSECVTTFIDNTLAPHMHQDLTRGIAERYYLSMINPEVYCLIYLDSLMVSIANHQVERDKLEERVVLLNEIFRNGLLTMKRKSLNETLPACDC